VKRTLIEKAIEIVSSVSDRPGERRDVWTAGHETHGQDQIDVVTKLAPLERFVFVMSILERHSHSDCALLLGCSKNEVAQARTTALRLMPDFAGVLPPLRSPQLLLLKPVVGMCTASSCLSASGRTAPEG